MMNIDWCVIQCQCVFYNVDSVVNVSVKIVWVS